MALDILHDNWGPYTHTEVENALKAYLTVLENRINKAIQSGGVGLADLSTEVKALLNKANTALQPENIAAWAKAKNKPSYNVSEITYSDLLTLAEKLADMDQKIQEAASSGGTTPDAALSDTSENAVQNKVVKAAIDSLRSALDTLIGSGNVQGAIDTFNEVVAFLNGINSSDTLAAKLLLKANTADVYTKTEIDDKVANAGKVMSVSVNGTNHEPNSSGVVDLGTIQGQKGDKGEKGDTVVIDTEGLAQFTIANDLDTSDATMALSARQGKILKQAISTVQANLQAMVDALANMAFTTAKPTLTQIDWTGGTFYATVVKNLTGCTATDNTTNGQIAEGQTLTMQLTASSGHTLTGATISVTDSRGQAVAYTLNGNTLSVANVTGTITVSVVAVGVFSVSLGSGSSNVAFASGTPTEATSGSSWTGTIQAANGYKLPASITVTMGGTSVTPTYNSTTGEITIANVTGAVVITAVAVEVVAHAVNQHLLNMTSSNNATQVEDGDNYTAVLSPTTGATSNGDLRVFVDGNLLTLDTDYTFADNLLTIFSFAITGDIDIVATASSGIVKITANSSTTVTINGTAHSITANTEETISGINTISSLTFADNTAITSLDFGGAKFTGKLDFDGFTHLATNPNIALKWNDNAKPVYLFRNTLLTGTIDISYWDLSSTTSLTNIVNSSTGNIILPVDTKLATRMANAMDSFKGSSIVFGYTGSITTLDRFAQNCTNLRFVDISRCNISTDLVDLDYMFYGSTPSGLTVKIGTFEVQNVPSSEAAQNGLNKISTLICTKSTPPNVKLISYLSSTVNIYVPDSSVDAYKEAWPTLSSNIHSINDYTE